MTQEKTYRPDWWLFLVTILLLSFGVVMVFDASYPHAQEMYNDSAYWVKKQILWACIGIGGLFVAMHLPFWKLRAWGLPAMMISLALLVAVRFVGHESLGGQRWLGYGPVRIQPSEFAKLALILYMARVLAARPRLTLNFWRGVVPFLGLPLLSILLVERQPDLGTALTMLLTTLVILYAAGTRAGWIAGLVAVCALASLAAVLHKGTENNYRWNRLTAFVNPDADPLRSGFQITHSTIALGTGGLTGVGFGLSREKLLGNLPAQRTDFIFAIVGEEFGMAGTCVILLGFLLIAGRGFHIAQRTKDPFGALLATGITAMVSVQALVNIAVVTASVPTTGIPLPFISYGGSSLVPTLFGIGILLNISQHPFRRDPRPSARRAQADRAAAGYSPPTGGSAGVAKERLLGVTR